MENKKRRKTGRLKKRGSEEHSPFHEDANLQQEQDAFDAENPPEKRAQALTNLMRGFLANMEVAKKPKQYSITIGSGYADSLRRKEIYAGKPWVPKLLGKTISTTSRKHYLELVETEADCVVWIGMLDIQKESKNPDNRELKRILGKIDEALDKLRLLISRHGG
jgi:hypothetical protein